MNPFKKLPLADKIGLVVLLAMLVSNALTGQYVLWALDWLFAQLFAWGAYIGLWGTFYLLVLAAVHYVRKERVNIPKPTTKTAKQRYIAT